MPYSLYAGEILPREPQVPRCSAFKHYSAAASPRVQSAGGPVELAPPRSARTSVSRGGATLAPQEAASPRARPSNRLEASALLDELRDRLSAAQRPSYADQIRLIDFAMAECARQVGSACAERGEVMEMLRAEYSRLILVVQGPRGNGDSLHERLRREQQRCVDLQRQLAEAQAREASYKSQWDKRKATMQLATAGVRLSAISQPTGPDPTGLEASAEQMAAADALDRLQPQQKLAAIVSSTGKMAAGAKAQTVGALLQTLRHHDEQLISVVAGALGGMERDSRALVWRSVRRAEVERGEDASALLAVVAEEPAKSQQDLVRSVVRALEEKDEGAAAQLVASFLLKMSPVMRALTLKTLRPALTEADRDALRGGTRGARDVGVQVAMDKGASRLLNAAQTKAEKHWQLAVGARWGAPRLWRHACGAHGQPQLLPLELLIDEVLRLYGTRLRYLASVAASSPSSPLKRGASFAAAKSAGGSSGDGGSGGGGGGGGSGSGGGAAVQGFVGRGGAARGVQTDAIDQLLLQHGSRPKARQALAEVLHSAREHASSSPRALLFAELMGVHAVAPPAPPDAAALAQMPPGDAAAARAQAAAAAEAAKAAKEDEVYLNHYVNCLLPVVAAIFGAELRDFYKSGMPLHLPVLETDAAALAAAPASPAMPGCGAAAFMGAGGGLPGGGRHTSVEELLAPGSRLVPSSVRAYVTMRLAEVEVQGGAHGERRVDADRLLLLVLHGFRNHTADAARALIESFEDGPYGESRGGVMRQEDFETQLKSMRAATDPATMATMLLDAQELSEMLGEAEGVLPQAFAAVCLFHGIDGTSMFIGQGGAGRRRASAQTRKGSNSQVLPAQAMAQLSGATLH